MNSTNYYFEPIEIKNNTISKQTNYIPITNILNMYTPYKTADILIVDDDPIITKFIITKMKNYTIKKNKNDQGRKLLYNTINTSNKLLEDIIQNKSTYGLIIIDENLGPDNLNGSQCIRRLRENNYNGAIISISGSYKSNQILEKIKHSGSNGFIPKSNNFLHELFKLLPRLIKRNLD